MGTLVCFHAHPDDESMATGGIMTQTSDAGHRVVLVCATRGELGEPVDGVLDEGEQLWERRMTELAESARILGAEEPHWLGYEDSGMDGEPTNDNPASFWQADLDEAAARLSAILTEVGATALTIYDHHGGYGHPDHVQVHRVGKMAAEIAGVVNVYEATTNRDRIAEMMTLAEDPDMAHLTDEIPDAAMMEDFGTPANDVSFEIDVSSVIERKRQSMMAHASQIGPDSFFLAMPPHVFALAFGIESFNIPGRSDTGGPELLDVLPGL